MTLLQMCAIVGAGLLAGAINTVVGSGTLITFPILLGVGVPPVSANIANNIGLAPGSVSGAVGYRRELTGPLRRTLTLASAALAGGVIGALLLLALPSEWFRTVAPYLVGLAVLLVIAQPYLERRLATFRETVTRGERSWVLPLATFTTSVYGGYFGAGQGVILLALMGVLMAEALQQVNALKNVLQGVDNVTSALVFALIADVDWTIVGLLAVGAIVGGQLGARWGRKLSPTALRALIVIVGVIGIVQLVRSG